MRYPGGYTNTLTNQRNFILKFLNSFFEFGVYSLVMIFNFLFRYPEIYFSLFLFAGVYKGDPRLAFLPVFLDLTIFFELLTILGVIYNLLKRKLRPVFPPRGILLSYIFIIILSILSLSYTLAPVYGTDKLLRFLFITSPAFFLSPMIFQQRKSILRFFIVAITLAAIMSFDIIIIQKIAPGEPGFHSALGSNYLAVGRVSGIALLAVLYLSITTKNKLYKLICLFFAGLFVFNMLISGGRGPLISIIGSIIFVFIYLEISGLKFRKNKIVIDKRNFRLMFYIVLLIMIALFIVSYFSNYFITIFYRIFLLEDLSGASIGTRMSLYNSAIKILEKFPTNIIGLGIGGFSVYYISVYYSGYDLRLYPHNIFLEIASELGVLGLFAFIFVLYKSFMVAFDTIKEAKKDYRDYYLNIALLALFVFMLVNSSVSGDINDNRLLFTSLGLIYAYRGLYRHEG